VPPARAARQRPELVREAFRWSATRKVTRTATVPLEGNSYSVDPALVGRRVELRYELEELAKIEVFLGGKHAGVAPPFVTTRHTHRAVPQAARPAPAETGIDYLGLVVAAHEEEAGTGKIDFAVVMFNAEEDGEELSMSPLLPRALNNAATAALMAGAAAGMDLVDDACAKKAAAEITQD